MCTSFLLICFSIFSFCYGQGFDFNSVETKIDRLMENVNFLKHLISLENNKYQQLPTNATGPAQGTLTITKNAFTTDVENRLRGMNQIINRVLADSRYCPGNTLEPQQPRNVTAKTETIGNSSSIIVFWEAPQMIPLNMQFRVDFNPTDEFGNSIGPSTVVYVCDHTQTSAPLYNIQPDRHFRVSVTTLAGPIAESRNNPVLVKTYDQIPPAPTFLNAYDVTPNTVTLKWEKPQFIGTIIAYHIHGKNGLGESFTEVIKPPMEQFVVTNLPEGTIHKFVVIAESDNGEGDASPQAIVTTLPFAPPAPLNLNCAQKSHDTIVLKWTPVSVYPGMGILRGYNITMKDEMFKVIDSFIFEDTSISTTNVTGLTAYTDFYFTASSFTRRRQGDPGFILYCKTEPTYPSPPRNLVASINTIDPPSVLLTWTPSQYMNDKSVGYSIEWGAIKDSQRLENVSDGFMVFRSDYLDHNVTYSFVLSAVNSVGYSAPASVNFTTAYKDVLVPPNVTVQRQKKNGNNLIVKWDLPTQTIYGYIVLYRKFEYVYTGRWNLQDVPNPNATSTTIHIDDAVSSYIVVIRCILDPPAPKYPQYQGQGRTNMGDPNHFPGNTQGQMRYQNPNQQVPNQNYPPPANPPPGNYQPNTVPQQNYPPPPNPPQVNYQPNANPQQNYPPPNPPPGNYPQQFHPQNSQIKNPQPQNIPQQQQNVPPQGQGYVPPANTV